MLVMVVVLSVVDDMDDEVSVAVLVEVAELVLCVMLVVEPVDVLLELIVMVVAVVPVAVVDEVRLDEVAVCVDDAVVVLQAQGQYSATPGFSHSAISHQKSSLHTTGPAPVPLAAVEVLVRVEVGA
mmetsp:Transcript_1792/g.4781  ORF Transcript_1792/g.4781 Transcript_1792/m.4781 type:complete len:126 (-) Transcript_1792:94-471(-)